MKLADIGIIGLGTMGAAIARNAANKKYSVAVYNRTTQKTDEFINTHQHEGVFFASKSIKNFITSIKPPRKILLMVTAGAGTDAAIQELLPYLAKADIIIDGGNAHYKDTIRRKQELAKEGIDYIGCGISGGEEGALHGPSMMVGGKPAVWKKIKPIFTALAARDKQDRSCAGYIGDGGAGHYVKMVHNGIEYGIMQLIAEAYSLLRDGYNINPDGIADIFESINTKQLGSFLLDTAVSVLRKKDDLLSRGFLIDNILDKAGQKGTGMWTSVEALERGVAIPTITEAVYARYHSNKQPKKSFLAKKNNAELPPVEDIANSLHDGMLAAIISTFIQGFGLIEQASKEETWGINLAEVARIWQQGCIIRMNLLELFELAFMKKQELYIRLLKKGDGAMRRLTTTFVMGGIPAPALSSALMYLDMCSQKRGSANMIQGMRDLFGAHTYERIDRTGVFHTDWSK